MFIQLKRLFVALVFILPVTAIVSAPAEAAKPRKPKAAHVANHKPVPQKAPLKIKKAA